MEKKKVLMVHNYYQIGGGEHTVFENEKNLLLENGHEVYTYTRSNDELKSSKWKMLLLPFSTMWSFKTFFEVRKLIRDKQIEVVHCHNTFPLISPSVYYAARSLKVPVLQTIHNFRFLCPNGLFYCNGKICESCREQNSFYPAIRNGCYRNSKIQTAVVVAMLTLHRMLGTYRKISYIFLTEFNRRKFQDLIDINGQNVFIKPNFAREVVLKDNNRDIKTKFVYVGRLDENKGIRFLLDAWPELPQEFELHIYGDGPFRKDCEDAAEKYSNIHFYGFCSHDVIFEDLADSAALVFPSMWYEGFPMIVAESFACSRPVVVSNVGNHCDVVEESGGGVVFSYGDAESFCCSVKEIVLNNSQYSRRASEYFGNRLTECYNYQKLSEIYDRAKHIQ